MSKYEFFLTIAGKLREDLNVTPLLFGSLGLQIRLNTDLQADDIDVLVPACLLNGQWGNLVTLMEGMGFSLCDLHEHEFRCGAVHAAFASIESLESFAGVDFRNIPTVTDGDTRYLLLTLEDYLKVYTESAKDGYRADKKYKNDSAKIMLIKQALRERDEKEQLS